MKILQCHSKGDRRFSALYAKLADGRSIETIYQLAKRDGNGCPYGESPQAAKGKPACFLHILGENVPCTLELRHKFFTMLWWIYFKENPGLMSIVLEHEACQDIFDGHRGIVYEIGRPSIYPDHVTSCCQAVAIAFLAGPENTLELPPLLHEANRLYWNNK
jgi:hypothetical protein